ncbi:hypothetical protein QVD17_35268 [Tagetes erecta]|uniref:G-box binding protein multifunctional mosaic region domain-containing protein n=1 Tax=Tagetes erecta TaxID=13708 RepID=A0AAD8NL23_TARER|nr:hypothetical protein QVD17_35268 [Tagetes erecta]
MLSHLPKILNLLQLRKHPPPLYPDWSSSMQAYFSSGAAPPFFASNVASQTPHQYMWIVDCNILWCGKMVFLNEGFERLKHLISWDYFLLRFVHLFCVSSKLSTTPSSTEHFKKYDAAVGDVTIITN